MDNSEDAKFVIKSIQTEISETINKLPINYYKELIEYIFVENLKQAILF